MKTACSVSLSACKISFCKSFTTDSNADRILWPLAVKESSRARRSCSLTTRSPIVKHTRHGEDIDAIINFRAVFQQTFDQLAYFVETKDGQAGIARLWKSLLCRSQRSGSQVLRPPQSMRVSRPQSQSVCCGSQLFGFHPSRTNGSWLNRDGIV